MDKKSDNYLLLQKREILNLSYWEHFKAAKDLALTLGIDNPKYISYNTEANRLSEEIYEINKKLKIHDV